VKRAEQILMTDRDYRHVMRYFSEMTTLRSMENKLREYLVAELDDSRAHKDSGDEIVRMAEEQLGETEMQFIGVGTDLTRNLVSLILSCLIFPPWGS
jgi:hypothetical protein